MTQLERLRRLNKGIDNASNYIDSLIDLQELLRLCEDQFENLHKEAQARKRIELLLELYSSRSDCYLEEAAIALKLCREVAIAAIDELPT